MLKKIVPALFILSLTACSPAPKTDEVMEPAPNVEAPAGDQAMAEEAITFVGKSSIVDHPGHFMKFTIEATSAPAFEETSITATIDLTSVMTDSKGLDGHLQREDFFNTAVHPTATFTSKSITKNADGTYTISGDMTIKGVTKPATFTATVEGDMVRAHYDLPRQDFGVGNDSYGNKILDPLIPVDVRYIWQK
jgi:polyisoprenoid-binding protein YceI